MAKLTVGIYHLRFDGSDNPTLFKVAKKIDALKGKKRTADTIIDDPIRARDKIHFSTEFCLLDFSRIPQVNRIPTSDLEGSEKDMTFQPGDRRPCKYTAVLLDPKSNTMYVQEGAGSSGIGHNTVGKYLKAAGGLDSLHVEIILHEKQGMERLKNKQHRAFKVKIAGLQNAANLKAVGEGDAAILNMIKVHNSPNAIINLSMDAGPGQLDQVLETAAALLSWNGLPKLFGRHPVKRVIIGESDEEGENLVNLLEDRIGYAEEIRLERGEPLTDANRYRALTKAFDLYQAELRRRFPVSSHDQG